MESKDKSTAGGQKTGWKKWGGRIGHFLMYGGWMVLMVVIVGIVIAASTCGKGK